MDDDGEATAPVRLAADSVTNNCLVNVVGGVWSGGNLQLKRDIADGHLSGLHPYAFNMDGHDDNEYGEIEDDDEDDAESDDE